MAVIAWLIVLFLGIQCSVGEMGCKEWVLKGNDVCCNSCHPGNRLVEECGQTLKELCKPCEPGTYTVDPKGFRCYPCTQCVGAQVLLQACTNSTDTKCGCRKGLTCGDESCSFCVKTCEKGFEPTVNRDCRKCPNGTFNDKVHQKCKPWSTKCSNPNEQIVFKGDALNDIKCDPVIPEATRGQEVKPDSDAQDPIWPLFFIIGILVLLLVTIIIIMIVAVKNLQKRKKTKKRIHEKIIVNPTDDPRTLIAIECSFHEAQQEQGSTCSSESLDSKDSSEQLIA
ncbi:tumor necrosis factor receptor superfamily member 9a [Simochromis diagramma]|uniref:tumor necrosis factor receptor superfamily member 9a n=1 Tax=Simochromis diagramma TaxID=43689 RepID=UPI001A7EEF06|nr:tumor necrosis factor receptor superfamily member 9a [Simochromis diagramma]